MDRRVEPELLDELPPEDARARRSRRDLHRINAWMGNARLLARALRPVCDRSPPQRLVDLGAGDGRLLWRVARLCAPDWNGTRVLLLDRQETVAPEVRAGLKGSGWEVETLTADVLGWLRQPMTPVWDVMLANLFLHHFAEAQLAELLGAAAARTRAFVTVEPRRSPWALLFSHLVGVIGCNAVTRHDAPVSVRAGFAGNELSRLWPAGKGWVLEERSAGWFSHLFVARRSG